MKIEIAKLDISNRFRDVRIGAVEGIAASFQKLGQLQAIVIRTDTTPHRLVCGGHRVEAAKSIGWTHIEAAAIDLTGLDEVEANLACRAAEIDENLARRDLDYAETLLSLNERGKIVAEDIAHQKVKKETATKNIATTRADKNKANNRKKSAEKSLAKVSTTYSPNGVTTAGRLPNDVVDAIAKETKLAKQTIHNVRSMVNSVGTDALRTMAGTALATKAEVVGLIALQKADPAAAADCMKKCAYAKARGIGDKRVTGTEMGFSPAGRLGSIVKKNNIDAKFEATKTTEGCLKAIHKALQEVEQTMKLTRGLWTRLPADLKQGKMKWYLAAQEALEAGCKMTGDLSRPIVQKRTGGEHKYPDDVKTQPTKDEVRKSLGKDAASIKAKAKKAA